MTALLRGVTGELLPSAAKAAVSGSSPRRRPELHSEQYQGGPRFDRGEDILAAGCSPRHSTVLLCGVACLYERLSDGSRQIIVQYPGDFCDLNRHVLQASTSDVAVGAATEC